MNIALINASDRDGGAAIATYRLHRGLIKGGVNSQLFVQEKITDDVSVKNHESKQKKIFAMLRGYFDTFILGFYKNRAPKIFSLAMLPDNIINRLKPFSPDVLNLFWIGNEFISIETLKKIKAPIVWTLHDMWPFTGGCHYDEECGQFVKKCGNCPALGSTTQYDLSRVIWFRKKNAWNNIPIKVVATSHWIAQMAKDSSLFHEKEIYVIPNGIDTEVYKPIEKSNARNIFNLPLDKKIIMFSAFGAMSDKRKGGQFLLEALKILSSQSYLKSDEVEIVVVGMSTPSVAHNYGFKAHYMGTYADEISQALLYSSVDVVVAPSMQENLSNTVLESLSCGTPVVAFNIGGMPDLIDHKKNGYLATPFSSDDLAAGIAWVLEDDERLSGLAENSRKKVVQNFSIEFISQEYIKLYKKII